MQILVFTDGTEHGPYSVADFRNLIAAETVSLTDFAWHEGLTDWIPVSELLSKLETLPQRKIPLPKGSTVPSAKSYSWFVITGVIVMGMLVVGILLYGASKFLVITEMHPDFGQIEENIQRPAGSTGILFPTGLSNSEDDWLVSNVCADVFRQVFMGLHPGTAIPKAGFENTVDLSNDHTLYVNLLSWGDQYPNFTIPSQGVWDVSAYAAVVKGLYTGSPSQAGDPNAGDLLRKLLDLKGQTLAQADVDLSQHLTADPSNLDYNEEAALLCFAVALRENAGLFSDNRRLIGRGVEHLAMVDGLTNRSPTWTYRIAKLALSVLAGKETDALDQLRDDRAISNIPPEAQNWMDALEMKAKRDWRLFSVSKSSSLLQKIIWFQVLVEDLGPKLAVAQLAKLDDQTDIVDWGRAVLNQDSLDALGAQFGQATIDQERTEFSQICQIEGEGSDLRLALSRRESYSIKNVSASPRLSVVGMDCFSGAARRHILNAIWQTYTWTKSVKKDEAKAMGILNIFTQNMEGNIGYDLVSCKMTGQSLPDELREEKRYLIISDLPVDLLPDSFQSDPESMKMIDAFYVNGPIAINGPASGSLGVPTGTTFSAVNRFTKLLNHFTVNNYWHRSNYQTIDLTSDESKEEFASQLLALDPDNVDLAIYVLKNSSYTGEEQFTKLTKFLDYNIFACDYLLNNTNLQLADSTRAVIEARRTALLTP